MARSHETAGMGHNGAPLSDDDLAALLAAHGKDIRGSLGEEAKAAGLLKAAKKKTSGFYKLLHRETGYSRKDFEDLLEKQDMDESEFRAMEASRTRLYSLAGLPVGAQLDMFERGDGADQSAMAYEDGKRAGLRGDDAVPPEKIAGIDHPKWMEGWHDGQKVLIARLGRAAEIRTAAAQAGGELTADEDETDEATDLDPATIDKKARALKKDGFMEPTPEERSFASSEAAGELETA